MAKIISW